MLNKPIDPMLNIQRVSEITTYGVSTIKAKVASGDFPQPVCLGPKKRGWRESVIAAWLEGRPTGLKNHQSVAAAKAAQAANALRRAPVTEAESEWKWGKPIPCTAAYFDVESLIKALKRAPGGNGDV